MAYTLSRIDRKSRTYELSATVLAEAAAIPPDLAGVDVALLPPRSAPTAATVWFPATYDAAAGAFTVLLAGPDADSTGALVVPASADLWMRIADSPEVDAEKLERITVLGGGNLLVVPENRGLPAGGSTGQVLTKASNAAFDALWSTPTGGSGGGAVASVNGKTGAVTLNAADVGADAAGAATAAQAAAIQRANHTGTQSADTLTDGTTNKAFLATERTKLAGIATGATANATDAQLRDRSTHTGTQAASTITGLATVATSGAYADLTGKPTTSAASYANTVALLGTSITDANKPYDQGGGVMADTGAGYFHWANTLLRQSMQFTLEAGVSGDTTGQMYARVGDVTASGARMCVVETGPNDVQGDSTFGNITTALTGIYDTLRAAGILAFATHIYPTTTIMSVPSRVALMHRVNRWISETARNTPGIVAVPWAGRIADPSTGSPITGALHDGIHPSTYGAALLGQALADAMEPYITAVEDLVYTNADPANLISNGLMIGGTTTATGWTINGSGAGSATVSKVARADGDPGVWQQITPGTGNVELWSPIGTTGWSVGDSIFADFEFDGDLTNATRVEAQVWAVDGSGFPVTGGAALTLSDYYSSTKRINVSRGFMRSRPLTIPSGATGVRGVFIVAGTATVRVSRASVRKVTI